MEGYRSSTALLAHRAVCVCLVHMLLMPVPAAIATRSTSSAANLIVDGPSATTRSLSNARAGQLPTRVAVAASSSEVERFAAGLLVDRLNAATNSSAFHLFSLEGLSQQPVIAVGFGASSALGASVVPSAIFQKLSQDDDAYFLALASGGSIVLAAGRTSGRGALNAVYGFLRDGLGIYILSHNVTDVPTGPLQVHSAAFDGRVVVPSFVHRDYLARAALPCSSDWACESNFSAAMGFNGYFAHNPVGKRDSPLHELYTPQGSNQSFWIGSQSHSIYKLLSPMEGWVDECLNESSVGWPITAGGTTLSTVPCPSVLRAHPSWFSCMNGTGSGANMSQILWPCPFEKMYGPVQPEGKFYSGRSHVCWTGDSSLTTALIAGVKKRLDAVPTATLISVSAQDGAPAVCAPDFAAAQDAGMDAYASTNAFGRYSPAMLTVLIKVANAIAVSHPGVRIETLAYDGSMEPPLSGIVLPDNVIVTLCLSGRDASAPLSATQSAAWQARIAGWQKVTKHLRVWAYTDGGGPAPRPNWMNVGDDLTYLADIGVEGYFSEGDAWPLNEYLKNYIIARKTFNASLDSRTVVAEFNNKFFGSRAGELVTQYNTLLHNSLAAAPTVNCTWPPSCQAPGRQGPLDNTSKSGPGYSPYSTIFPSETILTANSILASAASKVHSNPDLAARVQEARLPILYVLLVRWDDVCAHAIKTKVAWPVLQSKRAVFDEWAASFNTSVNAIHGPWLPQKGKYEWMQWGENRCDKACFEMEIFQNNTYPVCSARSRAAVKTDDFQYDVLVYGSTSGGVTAAVAASRHGLKVGMLVANGGGCGPTEAGANHIGGMTTSGLGKTDIGAASQGGIIGGIALEFYTANAKHYNTTAPPSWDHEPHVAQASMAGLLSNSTVTVIRGLTTHGSNVAHVTKSGTRIVSLQTADGRVFSATAFVDSSYEGDLLAAAGGSWVVGREAQETYNESAAGRRADDFNRGYQFRVRVSPFDASGNVLPLLIAEDEPVGAPGRADSRVQAYNFRLCATSDPNGQAPFPYPDPASPFRSNNTWELARRYFADSSWKSAERPGVLTFIGESPPLDHKKHKRDWNNPFLSPLNTDCIVGCNQSGYPHATVEERLKIWEAHRNYYLSLVHFMRSDAGVPADVKSTMRNWGLCADEFNTTGHWPPQLYVRETRRMLGDRVFTQNSPQTISPTIGNSSVGVGDYTFDSHPAQRIACRNGTDPRCAGAKPPWLKAGEIETQPFAWSEGNVQQGTEPYAIPYWVMTPKRVELSNLLVTATPSGSHIGFSSLRMEPQFMVLGHSAGTAAAVFVNNHTGGDKRAIQDVDPNVLTATLLREGQVLHPSTRPHTPHGSFGWGCGAMSGAGPRCIAIAQSKPNPRANNCSGKCRALAPNEWLANTGFWRKVQSSPPHLVSTQQTYLKKGVAQSNVLPPELVKEVPTGFKCKLVSNSGELLDGYDLCVV